MFTRQYRLPSGTRLSSSQTITSPLFLLRKAANNLQVSRFGFVVSKKIDNRAVVRNRTRRVLRSVVEDCFAEIAVGYDLLFILKKPIERRTKELEEQIKETLGKSGLLV